MFTCSLDPKVQALYAKPPVQPTPPQSQPEPSSLLARSRKQTIPVASTTTRSDVNQPQQLTNTISPFFTEQGEEVSLQDRRMQQIQGAINPHIETFQNQVQTAVASIATEIDEAHTNAISQQTDLIQALENERDVAKQELVQLQQTFNHVQAMYTGMAQNMTSLQEENGNLQEALDQAHSEKDQLNQSFQTLLSEKASQQQQIQNYLAKIQTLEATLQQHTSNVAATTTDIHDLTEEASTHLDHLDTTQQFVSSSSSSSDHPDNLFSLAS